MKRLIREVHRRSLWQVVGIYLAGSYGALEAVGMLTDNLGLPSWLPGLAFALLVIGLPIVIATAFVQEGVGPRIDDPSTPIDESKLPATGARGFFTWRRALIGGVAAVLVWLGFAAGWLLFGRGSPPTTIAAAETSKHSIAVLPFATRSDSSEDRYFAEGMHDDLLTQLAMIDSLTVISRTSVMQYAGTTKPIRQIAEELQVATILEGGVQRVRDKIRVNVQLIDAATDDHLWARTYDEDWSAENIFAIQTDLARQIAEALRARLTPETERRIVAQGTASEEALDLYFRARYAFENRAWSGQGIRETIELFQRALAADSTYGPAWAGLGRTYLTAVSWGTMPRDSAMRLAEQSIEHAFDLNPELLEAQQGRISLLQHQGKLDEALTAAERLVGLHPGSAWAHGKLATILEELGRPEEAVRESRRAVELDPLDVDARNLFADRLFFAGDFQAAIAEARIIVEMVPNDWYGYYNLGWSLAVDGSPAEALEVFRKALPISEDNVGSVRMGMGYAFAKLGQRDSALAIVDSIYAPAAGYDGPLVLFVLGDHDRALALLEQTLRDDPYRQLSRMRLDPSAREMVEHPRYVALIRRLGLD